MLWIYLLVVIQLPWSRAAYSKDLLIKDVDNGVTPQPKFTSRGQTFRVVLGDTLVLPCEVQDLGTFVILWRRGSTVITAATLMIIRDSRFRLVDGFNLEISNVMPQDAGDYVCQISDDDNRDLIHTVEILVPPSIRTSPSNGQLTARKGGSITLECKASGNPVPSIFWSRKDNPLPSGEKAFEGFSITLDKVDRHQAGVYQCTASNGVGDPVTVDMQLDVLYPPEIHVERSIVYTGEGHRAQLVCIIHGEPPPKQITWYQDSFLIDSTDRRIQEVRGNKHLLTILQVQTSDFGNYSCQAENNQGKSRSYIELSGRPTPAKFRSPTSSRSKDSYNLTWTIDSYARLEEIRLLYRKLTMNETHQIPLGQWHDVIISPPPHREAIHEHQMSHVIRGLEPASVYEVIIQAKNKFGWNEVSDLYQFRTHSINDYEVSEPDMRDLELTANSSGETPLLAFHLLISTVFIIFKHFCVDFIH
ncbi:roundabout homolog 1-like isoform X1 [Planococcus citri]|uniref:roundabout homolog 1-like isoform X1 n=1 Tax=Planococcus citri TaxID=170843 RepID=UPI0031F9DF4B